MPPGIEPGLTHQGHSLRLLKFLNALQKVIKNFVDIPISSVAWFPFLRHSAYFFLGAAFLGGFSSATSAVKWSLRFPYALQSAQAPLDP